MPFDFMIGNQKPKEAHLTKVIQFINGRAESKTQVV